MALDAAFTHKFWGTTTTHGTLHLSAHILHHSTLREKWKYDQIYVSNYVLSDDINCDLESMYMTHLATKRMIEAWNCKYFVKNRKSAKNARCNQTSHEANFRWIIPCSYGAKMLKRVGSLETIIYGRIFRALSKITSFHEPAEIWNENRTRSRKEVYILGKTTPWPNCRTQ